MPEKQVQEIQKSIGETLAEARKQRNLSVQEVSNQLRLDPRFIDALEAEDYDALPSPAYTRGYLRSYAKVLSLDADRIISQYNNKAPQAPEIIPDVKHPTQVSSRDKPVKAFTYLVTFILVLLLLAWVQSNFVVRGPSPTVTVNPESRITTPQQSRIEPPAAQVSSTEVSNEQPTETEETATPVPAEATGTPETGETRETPTSEQAETKNTTPAAQQAPKQPDAAPALNPDDTRETQVVGDGISGPDSIDMKLSADSWIEVYDAFNNRLVTTLAKSGDEIELKGTAPFRVKLGFAQGVKLYFDGTYFDTAPYSHGGVARFTLGE